MHLCLLKSTFILYPCPIKFILNFMVKMKKLMLKFEGVGKIENDSIQKWKFGLVLVEGNKDLVLLFGKRDPRGWSGEYFFPESDCIYGISSSNFLTNEGNIDYQHYVQKYPFFNETGLSGNQADNHRDYGAYFFSVE